MSSDILPPLLTAHDDRPSMDGLHSGDTEQVLPLSRGPSISGKKEHGFRASVGLENVARRTLGIIMLLTTVLLWTASNFLASVSQAMPAK